MATPLDSLIIINQDSWLVLLAEVRSMFAFYSDLDGDDRIAFASSLRQLAAKEEMAGIWEKRFGVPHREAYELGDGNA